VIKVIIFDWGRTLYDPERQALFPQTGEVLEALARHLAMCSSFTWLTFGE
jgi:hypothetical protein